MVSIFVMVNDKSARDRLGLSPTAPAIAIVWGDPYYEPIFVAHGNVPLSTASLLRLRSHNANHQHGQAKQKG
jgi:hypothetical protein